MSKTILIIGGTGLIGKTIHKMISDRNPNLKILIGSRKKETLKNHLQLDITNLKTFEILENQHINLIVVCTKDPLNNILNYSIKNGIDYIDITKPSSELLEAYHSIRNSVVESKIVFSSGWMGGITPLLVYATGILPNELEKIKIIIYYSTKDKAGESSADFMAKNAGTTFTFYQNNLAIKTKHFMNGENYVFDFDNQTRKIFDFDIPDLYIFNKIEKIPIVNAKLTFDSKLITSALAIMQKINFFNILSFREKKWIFGGSGSGDITAFEILYKNYNSPEKKIALKSEKGQSELTSFSTVLHVEKMLEDTNPNGIYFSHQLHQPKDFINLLNSNSSISTTYYE